MISKEVRKVISIFDKAEFDEFLEDNYLGYVPEVVIEGSKVSYTFEKKSIDKKQKDLVMEWKPSSFKNNDYVDNQQRFMTYRNDFERGYSKDLEYLNSVVSSLYIAVNYLMKENEKLREGKK